MLKTDYKDQLLDTSVNTERKYNLVDSEGNIVQSNVSLRDVTTYSEEGDSFGAADVNKITAKINEQNNNLINKADKIEHLLEDETDTNKKWIDGKPIYRRIIDISPYVTSSGETIIDSSINSNYISSLISMNGYIIDNNDTIVSFPMLRADDVKNQITAFIKTDGLYIWIGTSSSGYIRGHLILEYTKK